MKKIITIIIAILALGVSLQAQTSHIKKSATMDFEFNGIKMGAKMTFSELKTKFPSIKRYNQEGLAVNEFCYQVGESFISGVDNVIDYIALNDNSIVILESIIPGGIKVGDNASDVKKKLTTYTEAIIKNWDRGFKAVEEDCRISFETDKKDKIIGICYSYE